jgi:purine-binding chemotaxis protein CheW
MPTTALPGSNGTGPDASEAHYLQTRGVLFTLNGVRYAVDIRYVTEIEREYRITPVPGLPGWVLGVINLHGEIVSVVDLARFLRVDLPAAPRPPGMLLVAHAGAQQIGLMVDRVEHIVPYSADELLSPPFETGPDLAKVLQGVIKHDRSFDGVIERDQPFIRVLDCEKLLLSSAMQQFS